MFSGHRQHHTPGTLNTQIDVNWWRQHWHFLHFKTFACRWFTLQQSQYDFKWFYCAQVISHHQRRPSLHPCSETIRHSWGSAGGWAEPWRTPCSPLGECGAQRAAHHHHPNHHPEGIHTCNYKKVFSYPDFMIQELWFYKGIYMSTNFLLQWMWRATWSKWMLTCSALNIPGNQF